MNSISLKDASELVGKDQSTIRKTFQKASYKDFTTTVRGKIFIDRAKLLELYPIENEQSRQETEVGGKSRNMPNDAYLPPKQEEAHQTAVDAAMQALVSQLEAKDRQIDSLHQRLFEINSNHQRLLQQNTPQQTVEQPEPVQHEVKASGKGWKIIAIVALVVVLIGAVALGVALVNGWRFMK